MERRHRVGIERLFPRRSSSFYKRINSLSCTSLSTPGLCTLRSCVSRRLCRKEEKITPKKKENSAAVGAGREFKAQITEINPSDLQESKKVLLCPFKCTCS